MNYTDRLTEASYTAPGGSVHRFAYTELPRKVDHRVGSFEFSGINGTLHQDKGVSGEVYPLRVYFAGADYDQKADAFFEALKEVGPGRLQHPRWGDRRVQIISGPSQSEGFVAGAGQAVFDLEFQESLEKEFPNTSPASQFELPKRVDGFFDNFNFEVIVETLTDSNALKQAMQGAARWVAVSLGGFPVDDTGLGSVGGSDFIEPDEFAAIMFEAIRVPVGASVGLGDKLRAYSGLLGLVAADSPAAARRSVRNRLAVNELIGSASVACIAESVNAALGNTSRITSKTIDGRTSVVVPAATDGFRTRAEVLSAAVFLRDSAAQLIAALDGGQQLFRPLSLSEIYVQALKNFDPLAQITSETIRSALSMSFTLPRERYKNLQAESTLINECFELYGNIDDSTLDYFILTNKLTGNELLQLPRGKRVVYYV
jgi:hypothetical protein